MNGRFAPLTSCDGGACTTLVEPHVARCGACTRERGPSPQARGRPGHAPPPPPPSKSAKAKARKRRARSDSRRAGLPPRVPSGRNQQGKRGGGRS
jgi:hypothetical protein